jgi:hypothetical protein
MPGATPDADPTAITGWHVGATVPRPRRQDNATFDQSCRLQAVASSFIRTKTGSFEINNHQ